MHNLITLGPLYIHAESPTDAAPITAVSDVPVSESGEVDSRPPFVVTLDTFDPSRVREVRLDIPGKAPLLATIEYDTYAAEQYRIVRTNVIHALKRPFQVVVSSPGIGDGKTVTAVNLSAALALNDEGRTLLIDADLRRSSVHRRMHLDRAPGLAEVLQGTARLDEAIVQCAQSPSLYVLPAGHASDNPTDLLDSSAWRGLTAALRPHFVHVVVDSPPVAILADFDLIAAACSGLLMVVRPNHTDRTLCLSALERVKTNLTGVIVNGSEDWFLWRKSSRSYYAYYGQPDRSHHGGREQRPE